MSGNFHKSHPVIFYWARRRKFDANQLRAVDPNSSVAVPMSALGQKQTSDSRPLMSAIPQKRTSLATA
jgi:hypothetical protein